MAAEQDGYGYIYSNVGFEPPSSNEEKLAFGYIYSEVSDLFNNSGDGLVKFCYIFGSKPGGIIDALGLH